MARLGAAVNVVTTSGGSGPCGLTASAVCSVTDDPPSLLLCINRESEMNEAFKASGVLCVNTLAASQEELSPLFAGFTGVPQAERFASGQWTTLTTGAPVLLGAVVSFDCRVAQWTEIGTHTVFVCEVEAIQTGPAHEGLIYFGRAYHRIIVEAAA
jgi:flavin reductase